MPISEKMFCGIVYIRMPTPYGRSNIPSMYRLTIRLGVLKVLLYLVEFGCLTCRVGWLLQAISRDGMASALNLA
jgi:hypothetical protein